jgi:hypothetical protein
MEWVVQQTLSPKSMNTKLFKIITLMLLIGANLCLADSITDEQLVELAKESFIKVKAAKTEPECKKAIFDTFGHLNDSEKTRAIALRMFEFDRNDGRLQHNADNVVMYVFDYDPNFISDPSQLKVMMMSETNPRRLFLLASIANRLMNTQSSDFVVEVAPMLLRHEPLARMSLDSDYYFETLSDASFFAYGMIVRNLEILNADFIPADEKLSYPDKISILVKWLKENYPGCEQLGENKTTTQDLRKVNANENPKVSKEKQISAPSEDQSSKRSSSGMPWWQLTLAVTVLIVVFGIWIKLKSPIIPL